jgi:hypothetical protein
MKKGFFKKILATILTVAIVGGIAPARTANVANAASTVSKTINSNQTIQTTTAGGDTCIFNYTMPASGYVSFTITPISAVDRTSGDSYSYFSLSYKLISNYIKYTSSSVKSSESTDNYSFAKGTNLQFTVSTPSYTNYNYIYNVTINFTKCKSFESEGNGSKKKADKIKKLNTSYSGILNNRDDTDFWVFTAPKNGKYSFKVVSPFSGYFNACTYKGSRTLDFVYVGSGTGWRKIGQNVKLKKGQKVYVKVYSSHYSEYKVKVLKK